VRGTAVAWFVVPALMLVACDRQSPPSAAQPPARSSAHGTPSVGEPSAVPISVSSISRKADGQYVVPVRVRLTPASTHVRAGQRVDLQIAVSSHGFASWKSIDWGDHTAPNQAFFNGPACTPGPSPTQFSGPLPPVQVSPAVAEHYYRRAGTYVITVTAGHISFCGPGPVVGNGAGQVAIDVSGPAAPGNGPADPFPEVGINGYAGGAVTGSLRARDDDGYVSRMSVAWPDGATQTFINPARCVDPINQWPSSTFLIPFSRKLPPGLFTISLTATSTDCTGLHAQTITDLRRFLLKSNGWTNVSPANTYEPRAPASAYTDGATA
jgi:hypothetical protein